MSHLKVGVARCDITPAPGTPQGGWGAQTHQRGIGADLPLFATALVISDSVQSVAIIDVDAIGFDASWTADIIHSIVATTNIPKHHIRLSYTHTHSGPNIFRLSSISEGLDMVRSYMASLASQIAGAVWQAQRNQRAVRCGAGEGTSDINVNRRLRLDNGELVIGKNWSGPADHTVRVIRFDDLEENPVASIIHYACHPTTMAWQCQYFTPDYPGAARQVVEREVGGICLFLQGAAGNITPIEGFTGNLKTYRRLGKLLGLEASRVLVGIRTLPRRERVAGVLQSGTGIALYEDEPIEPECPVLRVRSRLLKLPVKQYPNPEQLEAEAELLREEVKQLRSRNGDPTLQAAVARATQATARAEIARKYYGKTHIEWPLQCIRIGSVALLSMPGEPFTEINEQIVAESPFHHTLFSGYSNGGFGYIPKASVTGDGGYEVATSPFAPEAGNVVIDESLQLLTELASDPA